MTPEQIIALIFLIILAVMLIPLLFLAMLNSWMFGIRTFKDLMKERKQSNENQRK